MGGSGGRPVSRGAAGIVWAATLPDSGPTGGFFRDGKPALVTNVTFEPCVRTAWHTHPLGQVLIVTFGCGLIPELGWAD